MGAGRPRKYMEEGVQISVYVPLSFYNYIRELSVRTGASISETVYTLLRSADIDEYERYREKIKKLERNLFLYKQRQKLAARDYRDLTKKPRYITSQEVITVFNKIKQNKKIWMYINSLSDKDAIDYLFIFITYSGIIKDNEMDKIYTLIKELYQKEKEGGVYD